MKQLFIFLGILNINFTLMAAEIKTEITINATPEKIWDVLTNFNNYSDWNPFILSLTGDVKEGNKIKVVFEEMTFKPKVKSFENNQNLEWLGHLFIPGLFDGRHKFELIGNNDGTTTLIHSEKFKGILVPLFKKKLIRDYTPRFESMNEALKKVVEK